MRALRLSVIALAAMLLLVLANAAVAVAAPSATAATASGQTYKVLVGAEQPRRGVSLMAYFPSRIRIHVGDSVHFVQNSNEIHTVTFLGGQPLPDLIVPAARQQLPETPSPLVFNPQVVARSAEPVSIGAAATWANSGIMGREPGQSTSFDVTFTAKGTYHYVCVVHGKMMAGRVKVVGDAAKVPTRHRYAAIARQQLMRQLAMAPAVFRAADRHSKPATKNGDGTWTHYVQLGYSRGQIGLMRFFPSRVRVHPGDTVKWSMTTHNDAPHTVTFLNGRPEPPLADPVPQQDGSVVLYVDPGTLFPSGTSPLTRTGLYNSGLLNPVPGTSWSTIVGDVTPGTLRYICLLHDTSGMRGTLVVLPH
jgi:plastocyanin